MENLLSRPRQSSSSETESVSYVDSTGLEYDVRAYNASRDWGRPVPAITTSQVVSLKLSMKFGS